MITGKVVLVAGAASGIGAGVAVALNLTGLFHTVRATLPTSPAEYQLRIRVAHQMESR